MLGVHPVVNDRPRDYVAVGSSREELPTMPVQSPGPQMPAGVLDNASHVRGASVTHSTPISARPRMPLPGMSA